MLRRFHGQQFATQREADLWLARLEARWEREPELREEFARFEDFKALALHERGQQSKHERSRARLAATKG